jgi:hypothetical protein
LTEKTVKKERKKEKRKKEKKLFELPNRELSEQRPMNLVVNPSEKWTP